MKWDELASAGPPGHIRDMLPSPSIVQVLDDEGRLVEGARLPDRLNETDLGELFRLMTLARRLDLEAIRLQRQGELGLHISSKGQEAAQVGSAYAMQARDWVFPQGRELPAALARGLDTSDLLHVWRGTALSHHDPHESRFAYFTIPIATQCLHAVGFALGAKLDRDPLVAVCYVGDGGTSEGDFHEALNMAAVWEVPCVFLVQNNQYALSVPVRQQTRAPSIAHRGVGYGVPGRRVDGNDVLACYTVTSEALEHARRGDGPVLIEAVTYRQEAHSTSDDPSRYRPEGEVQSSEQHDPIRRMKLFLIREGLITEDQIQAAERNADDAALELRRKISDSGRPNPHEIFEYVYSEMPRTLERQRAQLDREIGPEDNLQ